MLHRRHFLLAGLAGLIHSIAVAAEPRISDTRTISSIPFSSDEIKTLYDRVHGYSAELLPEDGPFEVKSFAPFLTQSDEIGSKNRLPNASSRRHAFSIGLEVLSDDQKHLPLLSRDQILSYLKGHFVSIQARIYREPVTRSLYLGPRCLAATRSFHSTKLTEAFAPTVAESVNNIKSFGLLLPANAKPTPSNLRTLVLVHKNELSREIKGVAASKTNYEYLFIRAREAGPDELRLHVFATSDERQRFHWLKPAESPGTPTDCSVRGAVHFTEYSHQGLYPKAAVIRRSMIVARKSYAWETVDGYSQKAFGRPANECITQLLDAIIDGEFKATESTASPAPIAPNAE